MVGNLKDDRAGGVESSASGLRLRGRFQYCRVRKVNETTTHYYAAGRFVSGYIEHFCLC